MSILAQEYVFGLEVTIDDPLRVEVFEGQYYLSSIENDFILLKALLLFEVIKEGATTLIVE